MVRETSRIFSFSLLLSSVCLKLYTSTRRKANSLRSASKEAAASSLRVSLSFRSFSSARISR